MDHEVVLGPCKIRDWLLNSSHDHFGLHQGKMVRVAMEFEVPKRHILKPTLSIDMVHLVCDGKDKRGALVEKSRGL